MFFDVHGNLPALEVCFDDAQKQGADVHLFPGDIIGYGPWPNDVMDIMRSSNSQMVIGNHEEHIAEVLGYFNQDAEVGLDGRITEDAFRSSHWTANILSADNKSFLKELLKSKKYMLTGDDFDDSSKFHIGVSHAAPSKPENMEYICSGSDAYEYCFSDFDLPDGIYFIGHTHEQQLHYINLDGGIRTYDDNIEYQLNLSDVKKGVATSSGVGYPRDGSMKSGYVLYDSDTHVLSFRRLDYDYDRTMLKTLSATGLVCDDRKLRISARLRN